MWIDLIVSDIIVKYFLNSLDQNIRHRTATTQYDIYSFVPIALSKK